MTTPPPTDSRLASLLEELTARGELSAERASELLRAAEADRLTETPKPVSGTGVADVLGYIGGALVLGAAFFLGFRLWDDLGEVGQSVLAIISFLAPAIGGVLLIRYPSRRVLACVLLAAACVAAGFVVSVTFDDQDLTISAAVVVITAVIGLVLLRSAIFYLPAWFGAMGTVVFLLQNSLQIDDSDTFGYALAGGFALLGLIFGAAGFFLSGRLAWTLAGLSGWACAMPLLVFEHSGWALAVTAVAAGALFLIVVRRRLYPPAVVGCLILLSVWPIALYQLLDSVLGVAVGLVAAGIVLIAAAVVSTRRRDRVSRTADVDR